MKIKENIYSLNNIVIELNHQETQGEKDRNTVVNRKT